MLLVMLYLWRKNFLRERACVRVGRHGERGNLGSTLARLNLKEGGEGLIGAGRSKGKLFRMSRAPTARRKVFFKAGRSRPLEAGPRGRETGLYWKW